MNLEEFKIIAIDEQLTDDQVSQLFLSTSIESEEEIEEIVHCLLKYRPKVYQKFEEILNGRRAEKTGL